MKLTQRIVESVSVAAVVYLLPIISYAACATGDQNSVCNPLKYDTIMKFVENALRLFVLLALPVLAFFIVLAGFSFIFARGNSSQLQKAKMNFLYVIIGTCLVLGAWLLASLIGATVTQITG